MCELPVLVRLQFYMYYRVRIYVVPGDVTIIILRYSSTTKASLAKTSVMNFESVMMFIIFAVEFFFDKSADYEDIRYFNKVMLIWL